MTDKEPVLQIQRQGAIVTVTLNRPARMNAMTLELRDALTLNFAELNGDPDCRAIVLTAAGPHFSAGADLKEFNEDTVGACRQRLKLGGVSMIRAMVAGSKPIIAAVEGNAYGAGLALTAASDYVVASPETRFCCAFTRVGFIPDMGLLWTLPRRVGPAKAKTLIALAKPFDGTEALQYGLVDQLASPGETLEAAQAMAAEFAAAPPLAFELMKSAMAEGLESVLRAEINLQPYLMLSEDHREGKRAFFEKRKPEFTGR